MKQFLALVLLMSCIASATWADTRTVNLSLPSMNCAMCPITVRKSLEKVTGVIQANVDYETKVAVVEYDDQKTNVSQLTQATEDAGFPSTEITQD